MTRLLVVFLIGIALCFSSGCGMSGRKIDTDAANQIQNGDTRVAVETKFGEPDFEDATEDGVCHVSYNSSQTHGDALSMVPYVNLFAGGSKTNLQYLNITYKDDVVVGHKYSGSTLSTSGGYFNMHVRKVPTRSTTKPAATTQPAQSG